jgi:Rps23 Pro-64 3,4-dihydroxylase Tpa1-like proline 4-hydroxylase
MYVNSFPINPTYITGGAIAVYEDVWPEYKSTIEDVLSITSDIDSNIRFSLSQTYLDEEVGNEFYQSIRTSHGLSITGYARVNENFRKINNMCYELISSAIHNYRGIFKIEEDIKDIETYGLLRYSGGEHYKFHYDGGTESKRSISVLIYLNDDYEGGEIEFPNFKTTIKPKAGTLILFPSNYAYGHIAHPVTSGTKYVIATWLHDR